MLQIGIIDDDKIWLEIFEKKIKEIAKKMLLTIQIISMYNGNALFDEYDSGSIFDILFLDIELEGIDGPDLAECIRNKYNDFHVKIVIVSSYPQLVYKGVNYEILGFLEKGRINDEQIEALISRAIKKLNYCDESLIYNNNYHKYKILTKDILYLKKIDRKVQVLKRKDDGFEKIFISSTLKKIKENLGSNFIQISGSLIINSCFAEDLGGYSVKMKSGEIFKVSRSYRKIFLGIEQ